MKVLLGTNEFVDCENIVAYKGTTFLKVRSDPLRVNLVTPDGLPSGHQVHVNDSSVSPADRVRVVKTSRSCAIFWEVHALVVATLLAEQIAHLKLDLRPLGIAIYDDVDGLHIGKNVFAKNVVSRAAAAINLA